jgi:beta-lactamase class A
MVAFFYFYAMKILLASVCILFYLHANSQKIDKKLQKQIVALVTNFNGDVGIYVKSIKTGKIASFQADSIFPTASMVKVPILIGIMRKLHHGEMQYHQPLTFADSLVYNEGDDLLAGIKSGTTIELSKVIMLMLTTSDNCASLWLQNLAGTGTAINKEMEALGLQHTRVNSRTPGREINRKQYGWGQTTPKEMVQLFEMIYRGKVISDTASKKMIRLLGRNYWDEEALAEIPPTIFVASKNGAVNASRSETLLVMAKEPYLFSIITKNQKDQTWNANNEGWQLARKLSRLLIDYYNK